MRPAPAGAVVLAALLVLGLGGCGDPAARSAADGTPVASTSPGAPDPSGTASATPTPIAAPTIEAPAVTAGELASASASLDEIDAMLNAVDDEMAQDETAP